MYICVYIYIYMYIYIYVYVDILEGNLTGAGGYARGDLYWGNGVRTWGRTSSSCASRVV